MEANPPILQSGNDLRIGHIDDPELRRNISISYEVVVQRTRGCNLIRAPETKRCPACSA